MKMRLIGAMAIMVLAVACSTSSSSNSNGVGQGLGSNDASGDVKLGDCKASFGIITCQLTITNSSDGTSDYYVEGVVENSAGDNIGDGNGTASHVAAHQTARTKLTLIPNGNPKDYTVKITQVQRTASV